MTRSEKAANKRRNELVIAAIYAKRIAAGTCRHCGGEVPCWSAFGDCAVGRRHTTRTFAAMLEEPRRPNLV